MTCREASTSGGFSGRPAISSKTARRCPAGIRITRKRSRRLSGSARTGAASKRLLLLTAILAHEFRARLAPCRLHPVRRAAFAAHRLDPGIALLHDDGLLLHRLADQALRLLAHRLLRHPISHLS